MALLPDSVPTSKQNNGKPLIGSTPRETADLLEAAGLCAVPLYPAGIKRSGQKELTKGKEPFGPAWGLERNTPATIASKFVTIARMFPDTPGAGCGLAVGPGRGPGGTWLLNIEADGPKGEESRVRLYGGEVVETFGHGSVRGGHDFLIGDESRLTELVKPLGKLEGTGISAGVYHLPDFPDLEIRMGGVFTKGEKKGQVKQLHSAVPPTIGTDGTPRVWNGITTFAMLPSGVYVALAAAAGPNHADLYLRAALRNAVGRIEAAPVGTRRDTYRDEAYCLGGWLHYHEQYDVGYDESELLRTLKAARAIDVEPGDPVVERTVTEAVAAGKAVPRDLPPDVHAAAITGVRPSAGPKPTPPASATPAPTPSAVGPATSTNGDGGAETEPHEAEDDPHRLAKVILARYAHAEGSTLVYHQDAFYLWDGTAYRYDSSFVPVAVVNSVKEELNRVNLEAIKEWERKNKARAAAGGSGRRPEKPIVRKVTKTLIANVAQALTATTSVDWGASPPFWIARERGDPEPLLIMPTKNELVTLGRQTVVTLAHTPRFFSTYSLPYDYRPDAPEPVAWLAFLRSQWRDDPESIRELQKWFGLCLTHEIKHQKILLMIGPTRSGRSTIREILTKMIGPRNVVSTSPMAMADRFGLENFVGKSLAIMGDARTGDTHDAAILMDRILRISGADPVEINRKGRPILEGVLLRTRLVIISNEMPNFRDNSGAIVGRYLPLLMKETFQGKEDLGLPLRLEAELPSIFKWSIDGLGMLNADGKFNTPKSARHLLDDASALASPVAQFVAEECALGEGLMVPIENLWNKWKDWADSNGHKRGTKQVFGRNLKPATGYKVKTTQPRDGEDRFRQYEGIDLLIPEAK
jgi:putative DNA primase/helicase